jgi:hypothetical protein
VHNRKGNQQYKEGKRKNKVGNMGTKADNQKVSMMCIINNVDFVKADRSSVHNVTGVIKMFFSAQNLCVWALPPILCTYPGCSYLELVSIHDKQSPLV